MLKISRVILVLLILCTTFSVHARVKLTEEEKLAKGWIVRSITYGDDDSMVVLDVKALINAEPAKVWKLLSSVKDWKSWMPMMSKVKVLDKELFGEQVNRPEKSEETYSTVEDSSPGEGEVSHVGITALSTFEEFDLPWPVNNDWVIRDYVFDATDAENSNYAVKWKQSFKGTDGRGGKWKISLNRNGQGETRFEYYFRVKRKEGIPKAVFEIMISNTVERFIQAIRKNA